MVESNLRIFFQRVDNLEGIMPRGGRKATSRDHVGIPIMRGDWRRVLTSYGGSLQPVEKSYNTANFDDRGAEFIVKSKKISREKSYIAIYGVIKSYSSKYSSWLSR